MCVAVPAQVMSVLPGVNGSRPGTVVFPGGSERKVDLALVPDADVGDHVITHSGLAISMITEAEARMAMELLAGLGERKRPGSG